MSLGIARDRRNVRTQSRLRNVKRLLQLEPLELRTLLTASAADSTNELLLFSGMNGVCGCPICRGQGQSRIAATESSSAEVPSAAGLPAGAVPAYSSNSSAQAKLYLNFSGRFDASWGSWSNFTTPAYDRDGNASSFSAAELTSIQQIWARVAEDFAPFNIDVTTIDPGSLANRVVAQVAIGGDGSWYGSAGGVAYIGGFYNGASNVGFAFEDNLGNGDARFVAEAVSHEAGHLFGLDHQSVWIGTTLDQPYNEGNAAWAPIMGVGYYSQRTTWHNGTSTSATTFQDDLSILTNASNGFGLKADDFGNSIATASALAVTGGSVNFAGLLTRHDDVDAWQFSTSGGSVSFSLNVAQFGPNLDGILELRSSNGDLIATSAPTGSFNASISTTLVAGNYVLLARSDGVYGNMGQYTLAGTVPQVASPNISVLVSGVQLASGGTTSFGSVTLGSSVSFTFTVQNNGTGPLALTLINPATLGAGFALVSNLASTQLAAGASTQFVVSFSPTQLGSNTSSLSLLSDDADTGTFVIGLSGSGQMPSWGTVDFFLATNRQATGDSWYTATASRTGIFTAEAYFSQLAGNINLEIYNASNELVGGSSTSGDAERIDLNVAAGEQLFIRVLGSNTSVTFRCSNLVSTNGSTIYVAGTTGDDLYVVLPGSSTHRVAVNGVGYDFDAATYSNIGFADPGGVDTLVIIGTAENEVAEVSQTSTTVTGSGYAFTATGAEFVQIHAGDGYDTITLSDRSGDDTFTGSPQTGVMSGVGYSSNAYGFDQVTATFSAGGFDQAFLYGSIGDDRFEASPVSACLSGPGFQVDASGYDTVVAVGGWGNDLALLADSAGNDTFIGYPDSGSLSGSNFYLRAANFDRVESRSTGGVDVAYLWDSTGDDYFGGSRVLAFFNGAGFSNYVESFDRVTAISRGGNDTADVYDSAGDDLLMINGRARGMEASDYLVQTQNFHTFRAYASTGNDRVSLQQLMTADTLRGRGNSFAVINADTATLVGFDRITAAAKTGQKPKLDLVAIDYLFSKSGW